MSPRASASSGVDTPRSKAAPSFATFDDDSVIIRQSYHQLMDEKGYPIPSPRKRMVTFEESTPHSSASRFTFDEFQVGGQSDGVPSAGVLVPNSEGDVESEVDDWAQQDSVVISATATNPSQVQSPAQRRLMRKSVPSLVRRPLSRRQQQRDDNPSYTETLQPSQSVSVDYSIPPPMSATRTGDTIPAEEKDDASVTIMATLADDVKALRSELANVKDLVVSRQRQAPSPTPQTSSFDTPDKPMTSLSSVRNTVKASLISREPRSIDRSSGDSSPVMVSHQRQVMVSSPSRTVPHSPSQRTVPYPTRPSDQFSDGMDSTLHHESVSVVSHAERTESMTAAVATAAGGVGAGYTVSTLVPGIKPTVFVPQPDGSIIGYAPADSDPLSPLSPRSAVYSSPSGTQRGILPISSRRTGRQHRKQPRPRHRVYKSSRHYSNLWGVQGQPHLDLAPGSSIHFDTIQGRDPLFV